MDQKNLNHIIKTTDTNLPFYYYKIPIVIDLDDETLGNTFQNERPISPNPQIETYENLIPMHSQFDAYSFSTWLPSDAGPCVYENSCEDLCSKLMDTLQKDAYKTTEHVEVCFFYIFKVVVIFVMPLLLRKFQCSPHGG